ITKEAIYVALDFEGIGSLERHPQEDLLLTILNASLSNMILFKNPFAFNRDMCLTFRRFQNGAKQFDDPKVYKMYPNVIGKELKKNLNKNFKRFLTECEGENNFISRIYTGKIDIYAWPMFNEMNWYTTLDKLKDKLDKTDFTYINAYRFLENAKLMLAKLLTLKIFYFRGNPLDDAIIYKRVSTLEELFNTAINMGIEQSESSVELWDRLTETNIPEIDKLSDNNSDSSLLKNPRHILLIDDNFDNNPFFKNLKLVLIKDKSIDDNFNDNSLFENSKLVLFKDILIDDNSDDNSLLKNSKLVSFKDIKNKINKKDEIWFNYLRIFLDYIIKRRIFRVKLWYKQNTADLSNNNPDIIQGNNKLSQEINKFKDFWNLCGIESWIMNVLSIANLMINISIRMCRKENVRGHDGDHICKEIQHECGELCSLSDKRNCSKYCVYEVGHSENEHKCKSKSHLCGAKCSLNKKYKCLNYCNLSHDKEHNENEHCCASNSCTIGCPMSNCNNKCKSRNHLHALEGDDLKHLCGNEHLCPEKCGEPGICRTDIVKENAIYDGSLSNFNYIKHVQIAKRERCSKRIPSDKICHDGPHIHLENAVHSCEAKCPLCEYYVKYNHDGLHDTSHGNMNLTLFTAEDEEFEFDGHRHIDFCKYDKGLLDSDSWEIRNHLGNKEDGVRHISEGEIKMKPNPELPKDFLSHKARTGFIGNPIEQDDFAKCNHEYPDEIHKKLIDGLQPKKSYCDLPLFHDRLKTLPTGKKGYLSNDGHVFLCQDPRIAAFHIIFVLDRSDSMSSNDYRPITSDSLFGNHLQEICNNRFGAALQATDKFIKTRISSTKNLTNANDIVSIILFDNNSEVLLENEKIFDTEFIQKKLTEKRTGGGTCFKKAIAQIEQVIDNHFDISRLNVVIFLSDGLDKLPENELKNMCHKNKKERKSPLYFNTIHFGESDNIYGKLNNGIDVLQKMAEIAQTYHDTSYSNNMQCNYVKSPNTIHLIDSFTDVPISLLVYKPILMQGSTQCELYKR
ncbi:42093_t:CDS:10, partial [Gigaspora margarita]